MNNLWLDVSYCAVESPFNFLTCLAIFEFLGETQLLDTPFSKLLSYLFECLGLVLQFFPESWYTAYTKCLNDVYIWLVKHHLCCQSSFNPHIYIWIHDQCYKIQELNVVYNDFGKRMGIAIMFIMLGIGNVILGLHKM